MAGGDGTGRDLVGVSVMVGAVAVGFSLTATVGEGVCEGDDHGLGDAVDVDSTIVALGVVVGEVVSVGGIVGWTRPLPVSTSLGAVK